jgi:hypothetical protein
MAVAIDNSPVIKASILAIPGIGWGGTAFTCADVHTCIANDTNLVLGGAITFKPSTTINRTGTTQTGVTTYNSGYTATHAGDTTNYTGNSTINIPAWATLTTNVDGTTTTNHGATSVNNNNYTSGSTENNTGTTAVNNTNLTTTTANTNVTNTNTGTVTNNNTGLTTNTTGGTVNNTNQTTTNTGGTITNTGTTINYDNTSHITYQWPINVSQINTIIGGTNTFVGDGTTTTWWPLPGRQVGDTVEIRRADGSVMTPGVDYTLNPVTWVITFTPVLGVGVTVNGIVVRPNTLPSWIVVPTWSVPLTPTAPTPNWTWIYTGVTTKPRQVFKNGLYMLDTVDYNYVGTNLTFVSVTFTTDTIVFIY